MVGKIYIPDKGDIVWLSLNPTKGHEQRGRRPALIISPKKYNAMTKLSLVCPITSTVKSYPFEVTIDTPKIQGVVISDQLRSLAWKERKAKFITKAPQEALENVISKIKLLVS